MNSEPTEKNRFLTNLALWEFRGLTPNVRAGLVPAPCGATTRVAHTPRNPEDPKVVYERKLQVHLSRR